MKRYDFIMDDYLNQQDIVDLVNHGEEYNSSAFEGFNKNEFAGYYAYKAQLNSDYEIDEASLEAQLEILKEAGADIDFYDALGYAKTFKVEEE